MHVLRHTAASARLTAGVDIAAVAAWLGDTVKTVLETYAHMMPGADERGRRAMSSLLGREVPWMCPRRGSVMLRCTSVRCVITSAGSSAHQARCRGPPERVRMSP
jgi:hypothetical protein